MVPNLWPVALAHALSRPWRFTRAAHREAEAEEEEPRIAQPVTMRAKSGGSTPTRGSDHAYGAPRPPQASAGASGGGGGALVPGTVFSFSAHRRQSQVVGQSGIEMVK